jgi:hypothetical protein
MEWLMATKRSAKERRKSRRRAMIVLVPTLAGVFVAGTAFAYWTTTGSGSATSASGTTTTVTVTQVGTIPSGMAPGGTAQAVAFKITNSKASPQKIASVTVAVADVKTAGGTIITDPLVCSAADFAIQQPTAINQNLPNGDTTFDPSGATIRMQETNANQDGCKNTTVDLSFSAA